MQASSVAVQRQRYPSYMLGVLTAVYAFNFLDRSVLGLLLQPIKTDLALSDTQLGFLSGIAFALFYSTLGIPIARWADHGNRVSIISITVGVWSAMVVFCGMATTYLQLLLARVGVAVGEAGCVPPAQSLIADYFTRSERARAMSIYMLGAPVSTIIGFGFAGWINEWFGWRMAFFVVGVPGLLLSLIVRFSMREPRLKRRRDAQDLVQKTQVMGYWTTFRALWQQVAYRHLVIACTLVYLFSFGIAQWVPTFLIRKHHIDTGELGIWYAFIWGIGGTFGSYLGGYLATRYAQRNERLQLKAMAVALLGFIPLYIGIYLSESKYVVFALMAIGAPLYQSIFGPLFAMLQEIVAPNMRAMSVAVVLLFSNLIGLGLGPLIVGIMSDTLHSTYGDASLQMSLLLWTPGYIWVAFHLLRAREHVQGDIETARSRVEPILQSGNV